MQFTQHGILGHRGQRAVFLIIGDSKARGTNGAPATGPGPQPRRGLYFRRGTGALEQIGADDLEFAANAPSDGSPWPACADMLYGLLGQEAVFVPCGVGSSNFAIQTDGGAGDCWDPTEVGSLYDQAVTDAGATLALCGLSELTGIFVVLGINDARDIHSGVPQGVPLADVYTAMDNFYAQLQIDFPGVPIIISQIGRHETASNDARLGGIRAKSKQLCIDNANLFLIGGELSGYDTPTPQYASDDVHLNQNGNNNLGEMFAMWYNNASYPKWVRSILSSQYDVWTQAKKDLLNAFIGANEASYLSHDMLYMFRQNAESHMFLDWAFMCMPSNEAGGFTQNGYISFTAGSHWRTGWTPSLNSRVASQNDIFLCARTRTAETLAGTAATLIGGISGGNNAINISQGVGSTLSFRVDDFTSTVYSGETDIKDDALYLTGRTSSTNKYLSKDASSVQTGSVASIGLVSAEIYFGGVNNAGFFNGLSGTYYSCGGGRVSTLNESAWLSALNTYLAGF